MEVTVLNNANYTRLIKREKREKNALILAHYYVDGQVQDLADYVGDSYYLSQVALEAEEDIIVFCGVGFMAESAKILSPSKTILIPNDGADCPMAHMVTPYQIQEVRKQYDDLAVVCYINSTAKIKALSDVCVTSANALNIVRNLPEENIFFVPDEHLGRYVASQVSNKNFIFNQGFCYVHHDIKKDDIIKTKETIPHAKVLAHPECDLSVLEMADFVGGTSGILNYVASSSDEKFIICTEIGIFHQLIRDNPNKEFYPATDQQICAGMKKITLEKVYDSLASLSPQVHVDKEISKESIKALEKMHQLAAATSLVT